MSVEFGFSQWQSADVFASADQVALVTYMSSRAVEQALSSSLESARDNVINRLVDIFSAYKTNVLASNTGGSTPLQISANLKLLALLCLGLLKNVTNSLCFFFADR